MNKNRLSNKLAAGLNEQSMREAEASQIYLAYAAWADHEGFGGVANFLFRHAHEERNHMMKLIEYVLKRGAEVKISAIPAPPKNPSSLHDCFEKVFSHEVDNTTAIYKLVKISLDEEDWATWNFLQWFVREQTEEETLAMNLLNKIKIAGGESADANSIYSFDRDLEKLPDDARLAQDVTATDP